MTYLFFFDYFWFPAGWRRRCAAFTWWFLVLHPSNQTLATVSIQRCRTVAYSSLITAHVTSVWQSPNSNKTLKDTTCSTTLRPQVKFCTNRITFNGQFVQPNQEFDPSLSLVALQQLKQNQNRIKGQQVISVNSSVHSARVPKYKYKKSISYKCVYIIHTVTEMKPY